MTSCIEANFGVVANSFYNISRVEPTITIVSDQGQSLPPLKAYTQIDEIMAILRGNLSDVSEEFEFNRGKQVTANCVVAAGMATLYPPLEWTTDILDKILRDGDKLYADTRNAIYLEMLQFAQTASIKPPAKGEKSEKAEGGKGRRGGGFPLVGGTNHTQNIITITVYN